MFEYKDVVEKLNRKLDSKDVQSRTGGGSSSLDYVTGHYVISKLNEILGQGNWSYSVPELQLVKETTQSVHYIAHVQLSCFIGQKTFEFSDYGYGDGTDRVNIGRAHEKAVKEAVTDGVKRCAKNLGPVMGLALYDKEQKDVSDNEPSFVAPSFSKPLPTSATLDIKAKIKEAAKLLVTEGKITREQFTKEFLSNKKLEDINDVEAATIFMHLGFKYPNIKQLQ